MTHAQTTSTAATPPLALSTDAGYLDLIEQLGGQVIELGTGNGTSELEVRP